VRLFYLDDKDMEEIEEDFGFGKRGVSDRANDVGDGYLVGDAAGSSTFPGSNTWRGI
jgi:hypothetical protein